MSEYNYTATDDDDEHGERYGVQALTVEYDPSTGRAVEGTEAQEVEGTTLTADEAALMRTAEEAIARREANGATVRVKVVCSCGSYTCRAIRLFGHPVPVFQTEIEPLPSQYARDEHALRLHGVA